MSKQSNNGWIGLSPEAFGEMFERIQKATGTRTQVELAELLEIRQSSISDAKRRQSIPPDWILKLLESHRVNPEWIKFGMEPMLLPEGKVVSVITQRKIYTDDLEALLKELVVKIAPEELESDIQRTFCMKYFTLDPSDTISDILNRVLPGNIASRVCANVLRMFSPEDAKDVPGGKQSEGGAE